MDKRNYRNRKMHEENNKNNNVTAPISLPSVNNKGTLRVGNDSDIVNGHGSRPLDKNKMMVSCVLEVSTSYVIQVISRDITECKDDGIDDEVGKESPLENGDGDI